jgi:Ohr subfamily peroxiredoxin
MEEIKIEHKTSPVKRILYTGKTRTIGGRDGGSSVSSDGQLNITLTSPGTSREGTNPEQLFAAGWSACFIGAMKLAAASSKVQFPVNAAVNAEVDLVLSDGQYSLQARLYISLPGLHNDAAQALVKAAHNTCPYSKATRGNIDVDITVSTE